MRRQYRADAVLRMIMVLVGLGLMMAWLYKALAVKDSLLGAVVKPWGEAAAAKREEGAALPAELAVSRGKEWLTEGLAFLLRRCGSPEYQTEEPLREAASWLFPHSPLCRFMAAGAGSAAARAGDPDPSYADYLARQKLMNESWYLALYGDENSLAGPLGPLGTGAAEEAEPAGPGQDPKGPVTGGPLGLSQEESAFRQMTSLTPAYHRRDGLAVTGTAYVLEQLNDFDFLMQNFYSVHASTTAGREEINAAALLARDLSIEKGTDKPQILIYHTHSQETFCDYSPENPEATVVGIGNRLTELLQNKGYGVIHDTTAYDIMDGELDRNHAYNYALDGISAILQANPSIQVVLDIHRDGVSESVHLVTEIDGKPTARIMFFNGMSQTPEGPIEYLPNPFREDNLAFSLQLQLDAAAYYPGFTRKIYLKGLRYNLHVRPRSSLIEVGAQTNTYEEALNAMEPLAELLDMTLGG